jgi:hypothetical protein
VKKIILLLVLFLGISSWAGDVNINAGGTTMVIPPPDGFQIVPKDLSGLDLYFAKMVAPQNFRFVSFVSTSDVAAIRNGVTPAYIHNVSVQTNLKLVNHSATRQQFEETKHSLRTENEEIMKKVEKELPNALDKANKGIEEAFKANPNMKFKGMAMLPPHDEGDRQLAFSMLVNITAANPDGTTTNFTGTVTTTFLFTKAKIFFTYVYGTKDELDWTRQVAKQWASAILAANPSDASEVTQESARQGFDGNQVLVSSLIGGVIGGLSVLFRKKFSGSKKEV